MIAVERTLREQLPDHVRTAALPLPAGDGAATGRRELSAAEWAYVARAVPIRQREFVTGRRAARRALGELGLDPAPLEPLPSGAPGWPAGTVGSITHCDGVAAAAVASSARAAGVGIDCEPARPLPPGVAQWIRADEERRAGGVLLDAARELDELVRFCAKEAVIKAVFAVTARVFDFRSVRISADGNGMFCAALVADAAGWSLGDHRASGRCDLAGEHVVTSFLLDLRAA